MRRFSVRSLMAFVLVSAMGLAALRNANELWATVMTGHTTSGVTASIAAGMARGSPHRGRSWAPYQTTPATREHVQEWYAHGRTGVGLVTGHGDLECLDFDDYPTYEAFLEVAEQSGLVSWSRASAKAMRRPRPTAGCTGSIAAMIAGGIPS
jgi:hypothetical protein